MSKRYPNAKWVLPDVIDPDTSICIQVQVPNNKYHLAAFMGALYNLTSARFWQDDPDHTALLVAKVWQDIYDDLEHCDMSNWTVRLNPTDCTEVQQFDNTLMDFEDVFSLRCAIDQVIGEEFPPSNPPAPGQPGPQPGGGSPAPGQCWTLKLRVGGYAPTLIALAIEAGWTIQVVSITGATTDGFLSQFPPYVSVWRCGDGKLFLAGTCETDYENQPSDPVPASPHLIALIQYPDATYRTLVQGGTYTVPAAMPAGNYQLLINNSPSSSIIPGVPAGELIIELNVCNAEWQHTFDFTLTDGSWVPQAGVYANYVAGDGWQGVSAHVSGTWYYLSGIDRTFAATNLTSIVGTYRATNGNYDMGNVPDQIFGSLAGETKINQLSVSDPGPTGTAVTLTWNGFQKVDFLSFRVNKAQSAIGVGAADACTYRIVVKGVGVDPF